MQGKTSTTVHCQNVSWPSVAQSSSHTHRTPSIFSPQCSTYLMNGSVYALHSLPGSGIVVGGLGGHGKTASSMHCQTLPSQSHRPPSIFLPQCSTILMNGAVFDSHLPPGSGIVVGGASVGLLFGLHSTPPARVTVQIVPAPHLAKSQGSWLEDDKGTALATPSLSVIPRMAANRLLDNCIFGFFER